MRETGREGEGAHELEMLCPPRAHWPPVRDMSLLASSVDDIMENIYLLILNIDRNITFGTKRTEPEMKEQAIPEFIERSQGHE